MGRRRPPMDFQQMMPITKFVRWLMIANTAIWFVGVVILEQHFLKAYYITGYLGLTPSLVIKDFFVWQPFTYLFVHDASLLPFIFDMLILWWAGSQLERLWGSKFFAIFYFVSGVGAAFLYMAGALGYSIFKGDPAALNVQLLGASAALFGLMVAYAIYFGEQVILFMFLFPMKAKYFIAVLGAMQLVMALNNSPIQGKVECFANLAGLVSGYLFLKIWPMFRGRGGQGGTRTKKVRQSKLRLVVNNDEFNDQSKPKYWN